MCVCGHSVVSDFATPRTGAHHASLFVGLSRQEHWSGCRFLLHRNVWNRVWALFSFEPFWNVAVLRSCLCVLTISKRQVCVCFGFGLVHSRHAVHHCWAVEEWNKGKEFDSVALPSQAVQITFLFLDPLLTWKSEVKWALESITTNKASGCDGIQLSYFKSWKMMLLKCCFQYASKYGKLSSGHRTRKGQFSFQSQRKAMPENAQTTAQLHSSHMLVK